MIPTDTLQLYFPKDTQKSTRNHRQKWAHGRIWFVHELEKKCEVSSFFNFVEDCRWGAILCVNKISNYENFVVDMSEMSVWFTCQKKHRILQMFLPSSDHLLVYSKRFCHASLSLNLDFCNSCVLFLDADLFWWQTQPITMKESLKWFWLFPQNPIFNKSIQIVWGEKSMHWTQNGPHNGVCLKKPFHQKKAFFSLELSWRHHFYLSFLKSRMENKKNLNWLRNYIKNGLLCLKE